MVRIFIIDGHPVYIQGLSSVLETCADFRVVGQSSDAQQACREIDRLKPDVVIMDAFKAGRDNIDDINMIRNSCSQTKIFLFTDSDQEKSFLKAIGAGVRGYFLRASGVSELIDAIRLVASNDSVVYSSKVAALFDSTFKHTTQMDLLSPREKEILNIVAKGHSNRDIAGICYVSEATVKAHLRRIMEKLGVRNRAEAVMIGIEKGLLEIRQESETTLR